ncbi:MAG: tetratricopeptide repeat protein [Mariprofundaceae bacterium]|nr:tetratricopeptide repeat protein [Mariprofundaceae bacterium]
MNALHLRFPLLLLTALLLLPACQTNPIHSNPNKIEKQIESHYRLGLDALNKNNLPKAFKELLYAESLDPKRSEVLDALGYAWQLRGDLNKSLTYYKRAIANQPTARTYNNYGTLLLAMNKAEKAEAAFRKALDDPRYNRPDYAYINLGDALLMQDKFNDAIAAFRQARLLNPYQELSRLKEAAAYQQYKRPAFAKAMYETILRDSPGNRPALESLLPLLKAEHKTAEARRQLQTFIKRSSEPLDQAWATETLKAIDQ